MLKPPYLKETIHNGHRRAIWHNYHDRATYMVTISKHRSCPDFGTLRYATPDDARIDLSPIGDILNYQIEVTPKFHPGLVIADKVIMPDHAHILIQVTEPIEKHFGDIIQAIKSATTASVRRMQGTTDLTVFDEGFHDRIVRDHHQLATLHRYIRENARRLAVRRANPEFFRKMGKLRIGDGEYQAYGNMQLTECPCREQVVVHRADGEEKRLADRERWLYTAANRGVLVSPFISPAEKAVRAEAEVAGGRFILIVNEPMNERYKPTGTDFRLCEEGRMLIVSIGKPGELARATCMAMNSLAKAICTATC